MKKGWPCGVGLFLWFILQVLRREETVFLLLRAQKKKQEKGTPASPGPAGFPYFSTGAGR
ncbi:MAG: hypothetical protein CVU58_00280 [Deltaproteobacteria bacterium HGW-Deltaproteobacteria-16]|nr:MAG: hypothetical protein CVU58_00280 [Deltaproteobacteria bacterium HGW-Deltaproteobacteria-16]